MVHYLVLYDRTGNCQFVAQTTSNSELQRYLDAGFIEVSIEEYERCAAIVQRATLETLSTISAATGVLGFILSNTQRRVQPVNREVVIRLVENFEQAGDILTQQFFRGEIDAEQWYNATSRQILRNRMAVRAAGVGGMRNMTQADIQAVQRAHRQETAYLQTFRDQLAAGELSEARARQRVRLYGGGALEQYELAVQQTLGLPRLPAQPGVRTQCQRHCKCRWDIIELEGNGNWDCIWDRNAQDSCDACRARERAFRPLQIRNGIIQPFSTAGIYAA